VPRDNQGESRIASPEMLPSGCPLPHLICSRPTSIREDRRRADQYGDAGPLGGGIDVDEGVGNSDQAGKERAGEAMHGTFGSIFG